MTTTEISGRPRTENAVTRPSTNDAVRAVVDSTSEPPSSMTSTSGPARSPFSCDDTPRISSVCGATSVAATSTTNENGAFEYSELT